MCGDGEVKILLDNQSGIQPLDAPEAEAWRGVAVSQRLHPRRVLGESMGASGALRLALAVSLAKQTGWRVHVSLPGSVGPSHLAIVSP